MTRKNPFFFTVFGISIFLGTCAQLPGVKPAKDPSTIKIAIDTQGKTETTAAAVVPTNKFPITLVTSGDLQGKLRSHSLISHDTVPVPYERGGIGTFSAQLDILKRNVQGDLLWFDGGNSLTGSWDGLQDHGARQIAWLNQAGLQATTLGNEDLELPLTVLKERMQQSKFPWIVTNGRSFIPAELLPFTRTSARFGTVGVIGIRLQGTASSIASELIPEIAALKAQGAVVTVALLAHTGKSDAVVFSQLLKILGKKNIDLVIGNPERRVATTSVAGIPTIQVGSQNQFFGIAVINKTENGHISITKVENPIPICSDVFKNQGNCLGEERAPRKGRGPLIHSLFLGKELEPTSFAKKLLNALEEDSKSAQTKPKVILRDSLSHADACMTESRMGQFAAEIVRIRAGADVALLSCGFIRAGLPQGPVTDELLFKAMPLDSAWITMSLTGSELKTLIEITHSGSRGFFPITGVKLRIIEPGVAATVRDLNGDGKIDAWEVKRVTDIKINGKELNAKARYRVALLSYLAEGGDDLTWWTSTLSPESLQSKQTQKDSIRSLVDSSLTQMQQLAGQNAVDIQPQSAMDFTRVSPRSGAKNKHSKKKSTQRRKDG